MLTLFLLGDLRLERDGTTLLAGRRKPLALLAFLSRRGSRNSSRQELASMFWGTGDEASARKSLRQCLSELRAIDGVSFQESDASLRVTPGVLESDVDQFEAAIRASEWDRAIESWRGDFISSGETLGGADWQHWLDGERIALRRQLASACDHVTSAAERSGEWRLAIDAAAKWRELLPDDSRGWCREINALQAAGRISDAITRAAEGEQFFRRELGADIPDDLARLTRVLGRIRHVAGTPAASLLTPDLCGRSGSLELLTRAGVAVRLRDVGRSVLVIAHEGLGKTRLLREFARRTRDADRDVLVIEAFANPLERNQPYALLRSVITPLAALDALAGCSPTTLARLADIAPEIRRHFRHLPSSDDSGSVQAAFRSALEEVARVSPLVFLLDDLPDADEQSQAALASVLLSPVHGVLVAAAGKPESWRASASLSSLPARLDSVEHCALAPLTVGETHSILSSMAPLVPNTLDELSATLHRTSGGIPGLLISAITHLAASKILKADDSGLWSAEPGVAAAAPAPPAVVERWNARYATFTAEVRQVVDAASILCNETPDRTCSIRAVEDLAGIDAESFSRALELLRLSGVLRENNATISFSADVYGQLAYTTQAPSRRRILHGRAARLLRQIGEPGGREAVEAHRVRSGRRIPAFSLAAAGLLVVAALGAAWYGARGNAASVPARTPVLLADVLNLTGDTAFDQTLHVAASVGLQQSRQVSLFPRSRVRETLARMMRPGADSILDEALAREVAVREGLPRVVLVTVGRVEDDYLIAARIIDPSSGADLFTHQERAGNRGQVLEALDRAITHVRRGVGESSDSIRAFPAPLPRVTTSSLEALKAYASAQTAANVRRFADAIALFRRAVELDSTFALAWLGLADQLYQAGSDLAGATAALAQAERHQGRLTERERLRLAQASAGYRGYGDEELQNAEILARSFPETATWYSLGTLQMRRRRCPEAIVSLKKALGFDSTFVAAQLNVATCHQFLGEFPHAVEAYNRAWAIDSLSVYQGGLNHEFGVALVRAGLPDSARSVYSRMARRPVLQDQQFGHRSLGYHDAWTGRWRESDVHFDSAALLSRQARTTLSVFRNRILQSDLRLTAQRHAAAEHSLEDAWKLRDQTPIAPAFAMYAGLVFVRAGQLDRALAMLRTIDASMRQASADDRTVRAILASRIALARNRATIARRELESAIDTTRNDYSLPALVDALLALGHRDSALVAAERFEQRAVFGVDAQDAWLRNLLVKGRIAEQLGRNQVATSAYLRLQSQLKGGDDDHPLLIESRRGLARLAIADGRRKD